MADSLSSISGVASGVDWKALVDQIIMLERRPAVRLEAAVAANDRKKSALGEFQKVMQGLQDAAVALNAGALGAGAGGALRAFTASAAGADASGRAVVAAAAGPAATPGRYAVSVQQLAGAQKLTAGAGLAPSAELPAGTLTLRRPGAAPGDPPLGAVTVAAGDTLATLRERLNRLNTGAAATGVGATLVNVSAADVRLSLTAGAPGAANGFTLDDGGSGLLAALGLDPAGASPPAAVPARDAEFTVDGVPVTRPTNAVSDVLAGVTLTLGAVGDATVDVARNTQATSDAARAFVDAYNKVVAFARSNSAVGRPLAGDPMLRMVRSALAQNLLATGSAADDSALAGDLATLGAAGISVQRDGTVALDAAKFTGLAEARTADLTAVLASRMGAIGDYAGTLAKPFSGAIDQREQRIDDANATSRTRIDDVDSRLDKKRAALLAQYSKYEAALGKLTALQSSMSAQFNGLRNTGR
jgi:flagellar hook-associated protein 2